MELSEFIKWNPRVPGLVDVANEGKHWFALVGPQWGAKLSLVLSPGVAGTDYYGTVLFAGVPVMVVKAGNSIDDPREQYQIEYPSYVERDCQEVTALFYNLVGSLSSDALDEFLYEDRWRGTHVFTFLGETDGADDGHVLIGLAGQVAWAMWDFLGEDELPVSPFDAGGWVR